MFNFLFYFKFLLKSLYPGSSIWSFKFWQLLSGFSTAIFTSNGTMCCPFVSTLVHCFKLLFIKYNNYYF